MLNWRSPWPVPARKYVALYPPVSDKKQALSGGVAEADSGTQNADLQRIFYPRNPLIRANPRARQGGVQCQRRNVMD